jgi:2-succinyl-5-enolpyruvyl-6-hydroxy-3-cyclohexene-1-carboxylate synthase
MTSPARHSSDTPLLQANRAVAETLATNLHKLDALCEPLVPGIIASELPSEHALFLASSMPIRDFDLFAPTGGRSVKVGCNRGASGIDGTVASAVGFARGLGRPGTLVIGDLALLHDLNSLILLANQTTPTVTIVVINNGGGAIFSLLPVASLSKDVTSAILDDKPESFEKEIIEKLFLTTHSFRFESAAGMFGLAYHNPSTALEFRRTYREAVRGNKSTLIELTFDWRETRTIRRDLQEQIIAGLKQVVDHA